MGLTHYILIRRDIPAGHACAQITHAAGESFWFYAHWGGHRHFPEGTVAVVLGVRNERALRYYAKRLSDAEVPFLTIVENAGLLAGQMTAIGVIPTADREKVFKVLKKLQPVREFDGLPVI